MPAVFELTQAEFARRRGVTPKAIEKAIDAGRIPAAAVRRAGRSKLIDVAAAEFALGQSGSRVNALDDAEPTDGENSPPSAAAADGLTARRAETEQYNARLKQLEFEQRIGKVRSVEDVTRSMEICAASLTRDLDQLPARADDLATAFTRNGVDGMRALLKLIARDIRTTMATNMRLLADDESDDDAETPDEVAA